MKSTEQHNSYRLYLKALKDNRMSQAFAALQSYLDLTKAPWELHRRLEDLRSQYTLMCDYALKSYDDPQRPQIYSQIAASSLAIADEATRLTRMPDDNSLYYSTLRYENLQPADTLATLIATYSELTAKASMARFTGNDGAATSMQPELERLETAIFNRVWVTYPLSAEDERLISDTIASEALPIHFRRLILSAVMLGGLEICDERRLTILAKPYLAEIDKISIPALCGLLLLMWRHRQRLSGLRHFATVAATLNEKPKWSEDVKMVFLQFIRTRDTEKITQAIREDIGPSIMKLKPKIDQLAKEDKSSVEDLLNPEQNPEWMDMLENSGIGEKLRKMSEMQQDGGDVMMSSFSGLKTFPFFNTIANWFLPFHADHSAIASQAKGFEGMINILASSGALCDSDKYSLVMSLGMLPESQRKMMEQQLSAHADMMMQHDLSSLFPEAASRELTANKYVQDLYRFFRLFRRKGEFTDPFSAPVNLVGVDYVNDALSDDETLGFLAEFYFKRGYYSDAADIFRRLADHRAPEAPMYQKLGYCLQQLGEFEEALLWYERAELIDSDLWTLQRLAQILKLLDRFEEAAEYYRRIDALKPENLSVTLNLAGCLLKTGNPREALRLYCKAEFLEGDNPRKSLRPIAWCSLLTRDFDRSLRYYNRIAQEDTMQPTDIFNRAHLRLLTGDIAGAVADYRGYLSAIDNDLRKFETELKADHKTLIDLGADPLLLDIVADRVLYAG